MKAYIIESGHFSKAGNFIAYSTKGERIHIYKKQILEQFPQVGIVYRCQGRYERELVKFPFYCMAEHLTFDNTDGTTFTRLTATEIHSSDHGIKAKAELQRTIDYYEEQLKYYTFEASDRGRRYDEYREAYEKLGEKYDELMKEHEALVAKVEHYDHSATEENDRLKAENSDLREKNYDLASTNYALANVNEDLKHQIEIGGWDDCINREEVERLNNRIERLEKKCQDHENTIMNLQAEDMTSKHVISRIQKLTQDYINKLIV